MPMKKLALLTLSLVGLSTFVGCSTPVYSAKERGNMISRNIDMEWKMLQDDVDHALMLRPMTSLTQWNIR
jgi:hypothetical protein